MRPKVPSTRVIEYDPLVQRLVEILDGRPEVNEREISIKAGQGYQYIHALRRGKNANPTIAPFRAVLNQLGYDLAIVPKRKRSRTDA